MIDQPVFAKSVVFTCWILRKPMPLSSLCFLILSHDIHLISDPSLQNRRNNIFHLFCGISAKVYFRFMKVNLWLEAF